MTKKPKKPRSYGAGYVRIRTLKDGSQRFDVLVRGHEDGKQKTIASCETPEKADAFLAAYAVQRAAAGKFVPKDIGALTIRNLGDLYLEALTDERRVTDRSRWNARVLTAAFIDWPLTQIGPPAVRLWIDRMARTTITEGKSKGKRPARSTLQNALNLLRDAFKWAVIQGHLDVNPAKGVTISESTVAGPRTSSIGEVFDYLREDEVRRLIDADLPPPQKAAFTLLAFTGARPKDLYMLTWARVDVRAARVRYRSHKVHRDYSVALLPTALEAMRTWWMLRGQPTEGLVFPGPTSDEHPNGAPHAKGYDWGWAPGVSRHGKLVPGYRAIAGIRRPVPLYSLRHTAASHLLLGTELFTGGRRWDAAEVASFLGHSDLTTIRRYLVALGIASIRAVEESREAIQRPKLKLVKADDDSKEKSK